MIENELVIFGAFEVGHGSIGGSKYSQFILQVLSRQWTFLQKLFEFFHTFAGHHINDGGVRQSNE